jgi:nicotinamide riboside kinase
MKRIGIIGAPGSGKTTLARGLSSSFYNVDKINNVELIVEYARRYITKYGIPENIWEQMRIYKKQKEWEDHLPSKVDLMITDSPLHLGWVYILFLKKHDSLKEVMQINDIFSEFNKINFPPRYDILFYLPPVIKPKQDGVRREDHFTEEWRNEFENYLTSMFSIFPPKELIKVESSNMEERISFCKEKILKIF